MNLVQERTDTVRRRVVLAASIGHLIEAYDLLLYGFLASVLAQQFFPADDPTAAMLNTFAIFAVGFAVRPLGGLVFGHIGDRFGRRRALAGSVLLIGVGTLSIGLLPTYSTAGPWAPVLLLACRLAQGFSVGGEYVGSNILVLEYASPGRSGRTVSINLIAGYLGVAAASGASLLLAETLGPAGLAAWGWRLPFLIAGPFALIGLYLRARIPDSPAFTEAAQARLSFPLGAALRTAKRSMLIFGGWQMMVSLGGFLLSGYMASYLIRVVGLEPSGAFGAGLIAMLVLAVGAVIGGQLVDRFPLRPVAIVAAAGIAVSIVPGFLLVRQGGVAGAVAGQAVWALFLGVAAIVGTVLVVVLFPVHLRFSAAAVGYNVGTTVIGSTAPFVSAWLVANTGNPIAPAWYLAVVAVAGLGIALVGVRTPVRGLTAVAQAGPHGRDDVTPVTGRS
jgi:MFS transporter, MHS family, proline/betaine transporter